MRRGKDGVHRKVARWLTIKKDKHSVAMNGFWVVVRVAHMTHNESFNL